MHKSTDYLLRLKPWSLQAFVVALMALAVAATVQEMLAALGTTLYFGTFFPAILVASFVAGAPAGAAATALTILIVWWAFMPPQFELNPLANADYDRFLFFLLPTLLTVWLAHIYREALAMLRKRSS
ncbi:DUF4118 domain-containing protein [Bradyrhizobium canariense]|uniref:Sensor protein KdpD transmembrane domain-containing protein n=1 Tax=Bradyrhizobium canariense TaxID=255045 RepID=A0A1H1V003_9BRAD|nr:DUF4118 domain-containing protein [Bradyrhizobium canariense]SDS77930.1 protein of unknown function [Bradyrhizobium canariense]